jgi:biliverdin reductase
MADAASSSLIRVGLVGTGYAAKLRAEALQAEARSQLVALSSRNVEQAEVFRQTYGVEVLSWQELVQRSDLDLVIISTINRDHGAIAQAALEAGKHVVVEYPLALEVETAETLVHLAQAQKRLLHIEHIELLGGLHQALLAHQAQIGSPFYLRYSTLKSDRPAPRKWTYQKSAFGFPLIGALSRIHRLTHAFGAVQTVSCQIRYWDDLEADAPDAYRSCLCTAQLRFSNGLLAEVIYGKGESIWQTVRLMEVHGDRGALIFDQNEGRIIRTEGVFPLEVAGRRGLFAKDTAMVLDTLTQNAPLYVTPQESLYALRVADAARRSAETGIAIAVDPQ